MVGGGVRQQPHRSAPLRNLLLQFSGERIWRQLGRAANRRRADRCQILSDDNDFLTSSPRRDFSENEARAWQYLASKRLPTASTTCKNRSTSSRISDCASSSRVP